MTNLTWWSKNVVDLYNHRGTAEQWIKEGKNAVKSTRLSCREFEDNQVRLQLLALAHNLANFLRQLALPRSIRHWTLTTLRDKLIKTGAKVVHDARRAVFQMAEAAIPPPLFAAILRRIERLRLLTPRPTLPQQAEHQGTREPTARSVRPRMAQAAFRVPEMTGLPP